MMLPAISIWQKGKFLRHLRNWIQKCYRKRPLEWKLLRFFAESEAEWRVHSNAWHKCVSLLEMFAQVPVASYRLRGFRCIWVEMTGSRKSTSLGEFGKLSFFKFTTLLNHKLHKGFEKNLFPATETEAGKTIQILKKDFFSMYHIRTNTLTDTVVQKFLSNFLSGNNLLLISITASSLLMAF